MKFSRIPLFSALVFGLLGCGEVIDREPYIIRVVSEEANPNSFDQVQMLISPHDTAERFGMMDDERWFNDAVRVSNSGPDLLLTIDANWFRSGNMPANANERIRVALQVYAESAGQDAPSMADPSITVWFLKDGTRIAEGVSTLLWPLPDGQSSPIILVTCKQNVQSTCMNP